jgi:hypothetical protein
MQAATSEAYTSTLNEESAPHDEEISELYEAMVFDNQIVE